MKSQTLKRITVAVATLVLLAVVTSPVTTIWLIKRQASEIVSDSLRGLATSSLATMNVSEGFFLTELAVHDDKADGQPLITRIEETNRTVDAEYEAHRETLKSDSEKVAFHHMIQCRDAYRVSRRNVIDLLIAGKTTDAQRLFEDQCAADFQAYANALGNLVEHNVKEANSRGTKIIKLCYVLLVTQILLLAFFFVYGFFVPLTTILERLNRRPVDFS